MAAKGQFLQWLKSRAGIGGAAVGALALMTVPVLAQWGGFGQRGGNFDSFFSPYQAPRAAPAERADYSRAPSPKKARHPAKRRQRAGAGRFHGRLAGLRTGGCAGRSAGPCRCAQEPREQRPDPLRQPQREPGLAAGDPRVDRRDQAEVHRDDGRAERPRVGSRSRDDPAGDAVRRKARRAAGSGRGACGRARRAGARRAGRGQTRSDRRRAGSARAAASGRRARAPGEGRRHGHPLPASTNSVPRNGRPTIRSGSTPRSRR